MRRRIVSFITAMRPLRLAALPVLALLAGCAGDQAAEEGAFVDQPVEDLYNRAQDLVDEGDYKGAGEAFEEVERQHPYSEWATRGQVMAAYAYYEANDYDAAIAAADRFIDLHPGSREVPYAHYLKGMSYYEQISDIGRDQQMTRSALDTFSELIRRYPDSDYARDAKLKIDLLDDHLAGKEMEIGRYYEDRRNWIAALNRFRHVVETYQTTTHVPEALHRLTETYLALGLPEEAQASAAVLGYNYPGSDWYQRSYALLQGQNLEPAQSEGSWLSRLF